MPDHDFLGMVEAILKGHVYSITDYPDADTGQPMKVITADDIPYIMDEIQRRAPRAAAHDQAGLSPASKDAQSQAGTGNTVRPDDDGDAVDAILWAWAPGYTETAGDCLRAKQAVSALAAAGLLVAWSDDRALQPARLNVLDLQARIDKALELHREFKIYDECGHRHEMTDGDQVPAGLHLVPEVGLVCDEGYQGSICAECCTGGSQEWQMEVCASEHQHANCWPCPTRAALESTPGDVEAGQ